MRRSALLLALLLQACDPPAPPPPPACPVPASLPPPGVLRFVGGGKSAAEILGDKGVQGFPSLVFRIEYAGPKTRLEFHREGWHKGKPLGTNNSHYMIHLPLTDEGAFAISDGTDPEGKPVVVVHESLPVQSKTPASGSTGRVGESVKFSIPSLNGRTVRTTQPSWPLEIPDGKDAVIWGVFVDEPAGAPEASSPDERARRADTAFLFTVRTADEKK